MSKRRALLLLLLAMVILAVATIRGSEDERGVYHLLGPGFELVYLPDREGPAAWLYVAGYMVGHWQPLTPERPLLEQGPEGTPTATPRPLRRVMELEQAAEPPPARTRANLVDIVWCS